MKDKELVENHREVTRLAAQYKKSELDFRNKIVEKFVKKNGPLKEGSNHGTLGGYDIKIVQPYAHKLTNDFDIDELNDVEHDCIKMSYALNLAEYRNIEENSRLMLDTFIEVTPRQPTLTVE